MKQKHTKAKKARRFNDWTCYQFKSGNPFASYKRLYAQNFPFAGPFAGMSQPVL